MRITLPLAAALIAATLNVESVILKGDNLLDDNQYLAAAEFLDSAVESIRIEGDADSRSLIRLLLVAGKAHAFSRDATTGKAYFDEAFRLLEKNASAEDAELIKEAFTRRSYSVFDWSDLLSGRMDQMTEAYDLGRTVIGDNDLRVAHMATRIGQEYAKYKKKRKAKDYLRQAEEILGRVEIDNSVGLGEELLLLSAANIALKREDVADKFLQRAIAIGTTTEEPTPVHRVAPRYPKICLQGAVEGRIYLEMTVDEKGHVLDPLITNSTISSKKGRDSDEIERCRLHMRKAAEEAVSRFRYIPKLEQGAAVRTKGLTTEITFLLE